MVNVLLRLLDDGEVSVESLRRQRETGEGWNKIVHWDFSKCATQPGVTFAFKKQTSFPPVLEAIS